MRLRQYPDFEQFAACAEKGNLVPVCREILADLETPVSALGKLRRLQDPRGPLFLLESVEGGEHWGRYSFLGASARCEVKVFGDTVQIEDDTGKNRIAHHNDPLAVLRSVIGRYRPVPLPGLPRFWGGLVGYFSYEMVSFFENIPHRLPADQPLAHFVVTDDLYVFDNVHHTLILIAPVLVENQTDAPAAYRQAAARLDAMEDRLRQPLVAGDGASGQTRTLQLHPELAPEVFRSQVRRIKTHIRNGDVIQAVVSQPFSCTPAPDPWHLYRAQRYVNPSPYMYFMHLQDAILVGSSPETMVRLENGVATLRPIAGTRPRGENEQTDRRLADELLQDPKERAEHLMLVDLGRNDLGRVAETGTVQVTDLMVVERYSHVMHLVSNITADMRAGVDAWDLIRATFPAGTLTGAPKIRAMEIVAELERTAPRGPYGGAVGYISFAGNMDLAITIRTAHIGSGRMTVRAGAGIVADSDPESERQETVSKAMAIQRALHLIGNHRQGERQ